MAKRKSELYASTFRDVSDDLCWKLNRVLVHYQRHHYSTNPWMLYKGNEQVPVAAVMYLQDKLFSKLNDPRQGASAVERRTAAIVKWLTVEERNTRTNGRITSTCPWFSLGRSKQVDGITVYPPKASAWDLLTRARMTVGRILGDAPTNDILPDFLMENGGFTGGASTSKKRSVDTLARKFTERMDATPSVLTLLHMADFGRVFPGWNALADAPFNGPRLVKGNILFTVPKNADIDRVACKEPDLNLFCQKSVGNHIRRRLRSFGIDLNDQTRNQRLAADAFKKGYATIDLSSASDSLTVELVRQLVSPDWFKILMALRSPKTFIDGSSHSNAMISSMGNGYTFELESLIFYALARSVQAAVFECYGRPGQMPTVGIFGDDIIVERRTAYPLIRFLGWCGFKVNVTKTFIEGALFESCGKHYYCGHDVSPFYIRQPLTDVSDLILALNQLRGWMIRTGIDIYESGMNNVQHSFYEIWSEFKEYVPRSLHGGWDLESRVQLVTPGQPRCRLVPVMKPVKRKVTSEYQTGMYLARLSGFVDLDTVSVNPLTRSVLMESRFSSEFPEKWTGEWAIRRHDDKSRFFGIATEPLYQEMV